MDRISLTDSFFCDNLIKKVYKVYLQSDFLNYPERRHVWEQMQS